MRDEPREHPALDGTERLAEPLGELRLGEPSVVGELERLPLRVGKVAQRGLHALALQAQEAHPPPTPSTAGSAARSSESARRRCSRRTASTARRCTSVRIHVLALPRSGMKRDGGSPNGEERLLHRVLGERLVAQDAQREPVRGAAVAVVQLRERRLLGPGGQGDERFVGEVGELPVHSVRYSRAGRVRFKRSNRSGVSRESAPTAFTRRPEPPGRRGRWNA